MGIEPSKTDNHIPDTMSGVVAHVIYYKTNFPSLNINLRGPVAFQSVGLYLLMISAPSERFLGTFAFVNESEASFSRILRK